MPTLEERLAYLEGRTEDSSAATGELRHSMREVRDEMIHRFEHVETRFSTMDDRLAALDQKVDRHFTRLVGIQMATLVAIVGALVGAYYR